MLRDFSACSASSAFKRRIFSQCILTYLWPLDKRRRPKAAFRGGDMRRIVIALSVVLVIAASSQQGVHAITGNLVKDFDQPVAGLAVLYALTVAFSDSCSVYLLAYTVFVTTVRCVA